MPNQYDLAVVVPTFNRAKQLEPLLERLVSQEPRGVRYEVVIVDNNSKDDTRQVVEAAARADPEQRLRYVFEPRQGVSYARNTGVEHTTAPLIAFLDDDGLPGTDWVWAMKRAFDEHPEVDCLGGRIKPNWITPPPAWMMPQHSGPIAVQDRPFAAYLNTG